MTTDYFLITTMIGPHWNPVQTGQAQMFMIGDDHQLHPHPSASGTTDIVSLDFNPGNPKYPHALDTQYTN